MATIDSCHKFNLGVTSRSAEPNHQPPPGFVRFPWDPPTLKLYNILVLSATSVRVYLTAFLEGMRMPFCKSMVAYLRDFDLRLVGSIHRDAINVVTPILK